MKRYHAQHKDKPNKYAGSCLVCGTRVEAGAGQLVKMWQTWNDKNAETSPYAKLSRRPEGWYPVCEEHRQEPGVYRYDGRTVYAENKAGWLSKKVETTP